MFDFIRAALPWVLIAIALAVLAVSYGRKGKQTDTKEAPTPAKEKAPGNYMTEGMCLGMCAGVCLGSAGLFDLSLGISLGMLIGLAIGCAIKKP